MGAQDGLPHVEMAKNTKNWSICRVFEPTGAGMGEKIGVRIGSELEKVKISRVRVGNKK